jgi:hypothetical protein
MYLAYERHCGENSEFDIVKMGLSYVYKTYYFCLFKAALNVFRKLVMLPPHQLSKF